MGTPGTEASAAKASARAEARARRRTGPAPDPAALAKTALGFLEGLPGPRRVTCYASYGTEPGTGVLRGLLADAGYEVLLPRVVGDDLEWVTDAGEERVSAMGIAEPAGPAVDLGPLRAMLIPALAVTAVGERLGKGGGYYDRVLANLGQPAPIIAALVGDADVVDHVPTEPHDHRVDVVITPSRVLRCHGTQSR